MSLISSFTDGVTKRAFNAVSEARDMTVDFAASGAPGMLTLLTAPVGMIVGFGEAGLAGAAVGAVGLPLTLVAGTAALAVLYGGVIGAADDVEVPQDQGDYDRGRNYRGPSP